jgi:hypothetical protein
MNKDQVTGRIAEAIGSFAAGYADRKDEAKKST